MQPLLHAPPLPPGSPPKNAICAPLSWQVPLEKGYSQVDWLRRSRATRPPPPRRGITMAEVRQHRSPEDAWMVFRGRVYAISPYLR
jgi:cytochrome b involved in lipid metabolism